MQQVPICGFELTCNDLFVPGGSLGRRASRLSRPKQAQPSEIFYSLLNKDLEAVSDLEIAVKSVFGAVFQSQHSQAELGWRGNSAPGPWKKGSVWFHYLIRLKNAHGRVLNMRWWRHQGRGCYMLLHHLLDLERELGVGGRAWGERVLASKMPLIVCV